MTDLLDRPADQPPAPEPTVRVKRGRRFRQARVVAVTTVLGVVAFALFVATMMIGSFPVSAWEVIASTFRLQSDPSIDFIVRDLRLPTAVTGLGVGLALGMSGLIFQKLLGNPLASPDFVGISAGSSMFAALAIIVFHTSGLVVSGVALLGAVISASAIYVFAWRGGVTGYRFVLIGIGVSEFFVAITGYVIARADVTDARAAMSWLVGSVGQAGSTELRILLVSLAVLLPLSLLMGRQLGVIELGDDAAQGLGLRVQAARLGLLSVSVLLVALATAAAGPVSFVALIAGPIAVRLLRGQGSGLLAAAFVGAIIVLLADLVAAHALPTALPTGVVTGGVGAPYLIWLLATVNREGRGG